MIKIPSDALAVLTALENAGFDAYLVGGCVRDMLLGAAPGDYDVCTNAKPEQTRAVFAGFPVYETGVSHGTLTVGSGDLFIEVTTYRADGDYSDRRRPDSVTFVSGLREDLARRDFKMNAMAADKSGAVTDFYGGQNSVQNKIIDCVGDAGTRFEEDSLRILRGLRFASVLGFDIAESTAAAMREKKHLLRNISAERMRAELTKLLCGGFAGAVLRQYAGVIFEVLPELAQGSTYHGRDAWEHTILVLENIPPVGFLRWAALLRINAEIAETVLTRLKFDNKTKEKILLLISQRDISLTPDAAFIKRKLNQLGEANLRDLLLIIRADSHNRPEKIAAFEALLNGIIAEKSCFTLKQLAINGGDLIDAGFSHGKEIGSALRFLLNAVIDGKCENNKEALLRYSLKNFFLFCKD